MNTADDEVEKLVSMAEEVSHTVSDLGRNLFKYKINFALSCLGIYFFLLVSFFSYKGINDGSRIPDSVLLSTLFVGIVCSVLCTILAMQVLRNVQYVRRTLRIERDILLHLLDMIHEYRSSFARGGVSFVESAIIDLRLKRIEFS